MWCHNFGNFVGLWFVSQASSCCILCNRFLERQEMRTGFQFNGRDQLEDEDNTEVIHEHIGCGDMD